MSLYQHLEKIKNISEITRYGSINLASKSLGLAQPTLSTSVKVIEQQIGCQLFTRTNKGVIPTDAGKILSDFATKLKSLSDQIEAQILGIDTSVPFPLHLAAPESISIYVIPEFIKHLKSNYPNLSLVFKTGQQSKSLSMLKSSQIDIALTIEPEDGKKYFSETVFVDHFSFYCLPNLAQEYKKLPLIVSEQCLNIMNRRENSKALKIIQKNKNSIQCESNETVRALTEEGLGIGLLPNIVANKSLKHGRLSLLNTHLTPANIGEHKICLTLLKERRDEHTINFVLDEFFRFFKNWKMRPVKLP